MYTLRLFLEESREVGGGKVFYRETKSAGEVFRIFTTIHSSHSLGECVKKFEVPAYQRNDESHHPFKLERYRED